MAVNKTPECNDNFYTEGKKSYMPSFTRKNSLGTCELSGGSR